MIKHIYPACTIKEGSWLDFRDQVKEVNLELFNIIEQIAPDSKYKLFEVSYPYGEKITDLGTICLPDKDGHLLRLNDSRLPQKYRDLLGYCPTPLILQLTKSAEVFVDTGERIIPLNVFLPGDLYGLFEAVIPLTGCPTSPCWSVTSGGRSVFLGAKVSDTLGHKKLKKEYGFNIEPPKKLSDQWDIIKIIANRSYTNSPWQSKILIFTKDWCEKKDDDIGWLKFHNYLLVASWIQSKYMRSKSELSIIWEAFASAVKNRNLKPSSYILDTLMHTIFLANGAAPGFKSADSSELILPSTAIEYAYENIYQLKEYAAIVMHPYRLGAQDDYSPVYYSIRYPTMLECSPSIKNSSSVIAELRNVKVLMETLQDVLEKNYKKAHEIIKNLIFEYFHTEEDPFKEIIKSNEIIVGDKNLINSADRFKHKLFPYQGHFFRGCIRISKKLNDNKN